MTDYAELKRLAHDASETEIDWLDRHWLASIMADDWADFIAAANPAAVLALIAENERLREDHDKAWRLSGVNLENLGVALAEIDRLGADLERQTELRRQEWNRVEGLKVDAERYRAFRAIGVNQADWSAEGFDAEADRAIAAAMTEEGAQ